MAFLSRSRLPRRVGAIVSLLFLGAAALVPCGAAGERSPGRRALEGTATYYAKRFHGRRTSSGERHSSEAFTAAHATLPLGTRVKVTNLSNDREVVVTVNDRCRKRHSNNIDLSRAAARELGFLGKGRARVRIDSVALAERPSEEAGLGAVDGLEESAGLQEGAGLQESALE